MKGKFLLLLCFLCSFQLLCAQEGIQFYKGSFEDALAEARREGKLVFMDVYTPWCGPCLNMEEQVFSQYRVGEFYNRNFLNIKMDWESKEGKELAQRYRVASFPAFLFIDPGNGDVVHEHGGVQMVEVFLSIGKDAQEPEKRSSYLSRKYTEGNCSRVILLEYASYMAQWRQMKEALALLQEAVVKYGLSMQDRDVAEFFFDFFTLTELKHPLTRQFLEQREDMIRRYGKEKVGRKIFSLYRFVRDREEIERLEHFQGKKFILQSLDLDRQLSEKNYENADRIIWNMVEEAETDRADVFELMKFVARAALKQGGETEWKKMCLAYLQFVAYNQPERKDPDIHFYYASMLERFIRENPEIHSFFPQSVAGKPVMGKEVYSLSSRALVPKK